MYTIEEPDVVINELIDYFQSSNFEVKMNEKKYKLKAINEDLVVNGKIGKVDENIYCIKLEKVLGSKFDFLDTFDEIKTYLTELDMIL